MRWLLATTQTPPDVPAALLPVGGAGVGEHVATDGLLRVSVVHRVSWVSHHLVGHVDGHVELLG